MNHRVSHRLLPLSLMLAHIRSDDERRPDLSVRGSASSAGEPERLGAVLALPGHRQRQIALRAVPLASDVSSPALGGEGPASGHLRREGRFSAAPGKDGAAELVAAKPLLGGVQIKIPGRLAAVILSDD